MKSFNHIGPCVTALLLVGGLYSMACSDANTGGGGGATSDAGTTGVPSTAGMSTGGSTPTTGGTPPVGNGGTSSGSSQGGAAQAGMTSKGGAGGVSTAGTGGAPGEAGAGGKGGAGMGGAAGTGGGGGGGAMKSKGCGATSWPMSKAGNTIMVSGQSRSYILRIPDNYDTNHPYRLIVAYHWLNGTAENVANGNSGATFKPYYGLWDLAQGSTIFVAPQGINNGWSDSGRSMTEGGQDVAFSRALIEQLENTLCIDTSRIFAEGFSMGGSMSYAMACAMGDVLRGVAVHSGGPMSGCVTHSKPVAYFMTHGTKDSVCTYPQYGVPQLQDFAKLNGCMDATLPTPTSMDKSCIDFQGCSAGHPTRACLFVGDHTPSPGGMNTWAPAETWKFISQF
jgi:poly(3-hydroxybutyrate) depolymerase